MSAASTAAAASTATASVEKSSAADGERKRPRVARPGPALHANSSETKRLATAILEVLAGVRSPADAAKTLDISLPRYYLLEQRALAGLLAACEPRTKGPGPSVERETAKLQRELAASQRECARQQSLLRAAQRVVGLTPPQPPKVTPKNGPKKTRRRRPTARALRAARAIEVNSSGTNEANGVQPSPSAGSDGRDAQPPPRPPQPFGAVDHGGSP
jgi:hypothetical protein